MQTRASLQASRTRRRPAHLQVHVTEDDAVSAGLACAGGATLLGHPLSPGAAAALGAALQAGRPAALVADVTGATHLVLTGDRLDSPMGTLGNAGLDTTAAKAVAALLRQGATATTLTELQPVGADKPVNALIDLWLPVPSILVVGGGALAEALATKLRCSAGPTTGC